MDAFRALEPEKKPKKCWVRAKSEQEALEGAAELLFRKPEELEVLSSRPGQFHVAVTFVEADFCFAVDEAAMRVVVQSFTVPEKARPSTLSTVQRQLELAGVVFGIDEQAIEEVLVSLDGTLDTQTVIASGQPPQSAQNAAIEIQGLWDNTVVFPGDVLALVLPGSSAKEGCTVFGESISPDSEVIDFVLDVQEGAILDTENDQVVADCYGTPWVDQGEIGVDSGIIVAPDASRIQMEIRAQRIDGRAIAVKDVRSLLEDLGVDASCVEVEAIRESVREVWDNPNQHSAVLVATATEPQIARPEHVEMLVAEEEICFPDQDVLRIHPATEAVVGQDVYGKALLPEGSIDAEANVFEEGLLVSKDGLRVGIALPGRVKKVENKFSLVPAVRVSPDGLCAFVDIPPQGPDGAEMTEAVLKGWLNELGVLEECIDQDGLVRGLHLALSKKESIDNCMVAVGRPPIEAWEAEYRPLKVGQKTGAMPGDVIVQIEQAEPAQPGMSVTGQSIPVADTQIDGKRFRVGDGCRETPDAIQATTYGRVVIEKGVVSVEPALEIAEDGSIAHLLVYYRRIGGSRFDGQGLETFLIEQGLDPECIDRALLYRAAAGKKSRRIEVASFIAPEEPEDARVHFSGDATGFPVFPGDRLAWVEASKPGKPGKTVLGDSIAPEHVAVEFELEAGEYSGLEEDGTVILARAYGFARVADVSSAGQRVFRGSVAPSIEVDEDRQSCRMDVFPENIHGDLIGVERLVQVLRQSGIVDQSIDRQAIADAIATSGGVPQKGVLVARGQMPSSGKDWVVRPLATESVAVVFPGDPIAEVVAQIPGKAGWDLEGKPISPEEDERGIALYVGRHCSMEDSGGRAIADVYGRLRVEGLRVDVVPGFRFSPSLLSLFMDVFPTRTDGTRITQKALLTQIENLGVPSNFIDKDALSAALRTAWDSGVVQWHVEVARGVLPVPGEDGRLELVGDHGRGGVLPGDVLARLIPEKTAQAGQDVLGKAIPVSSTTRPVKLDLDSGCELREQSELVATIYGRPFVDGGRVMVQSSIHLAKDGMRVSIDLFPHRSNGEPVTTSDVTEILRARGVLDDLLDEDAITAGLTEAEQRGGMYWDFEVALGQEAVLGKDGSADWLGQPDGCVFPEDAFARFNPHTPGIPGKTVDGRLMPPSEEPSRVRLLQGDGCKISPDGLLALAEIYGQPVLEDCLASVVSAFRLSEDEMSAYLDIWPFRVNKEPVTLEVLKNLILGFGVEEVCIQTDSIQNALEEAKNTGVVIRDVCVAKGTEPVAGVDGQYEIPGEIGLSCVFSGDSVGRLVLPVLPQPGQTVRGKKINPDQGVREFKFVTKEGVVFDPETLQLMAEDYGHIVVSTGRVTERSGTGVTSTEQIEVSLVSGLSFNETKLVCRMDVFPQRLNGEGVEDEALREVLLDAGVMEDRILERVLAGARKAAARQIRPQMGITVAKGKYPRHGTDGSLELMLAQQAQAGEAGAFGRIDFRERNAFVEVESGTSLGSLSNPTDGKPGQTVLGEAIDARDGKESALEMGPGVAMEEGVVTAVREGVLTIRGNFIDVVELLVIEGDVDYRIGNVKVQSGSVRITGSVLPGFEIHCPEDVEVGEVVEGATIVAGGNVIVRGGVVAGKDTTSSVEAGGEISVGLARNSVLKAQGDVVVQKELLHCEVETEERLVADRKPGLVSGGKLFARRGAVVCQLGSSQWTPTVLKVGGVPKLVSELQRDLAIAKRQRLRLNDRLEGLSDAEALSACTPEERPQVEVLCGQRAEVRAEVHAIEQKLSDLLSKHEADPHCLVVIKDSLYPRVVLNFPQAQHNAEVQVSRSRFFYNPNERQVEYLDLGAALPDYLGYGEEEP